MDNKEAAMRRLMSEIQKGWDSAEKEAWLDVEAVEAMLRGS